MNERRGEGVKERRGKRVCMLLFKLMSTSCLVMKSERHAEVFWENQKQFNQKYSDDLLSPLSCMYSASMHTVEHMGSQEYYHGLAGTEDDMHSRIRLYQAAHLAGLQLERRVLVY